ncbi:MAG: GNAT family N-acetyltransferase [Thermoplasmata archaeon]|nr:GNAT family N-acetyltransferase [Thermoplasmata archaeon]
MERLEIHDVNRENIDDLINLCIPLNKKDDQIFIEGAKVKKRWGHQVIEKYGSPGKIAYLNSKPAGLLQYLPVLEEKLVEIGCIFVPENQNCRKGVGRALVQAAISEFLSSKPWFDNQKPRAIITYAFSVPGRYPQSEFYKKMGFREVGADDPLLLYYPLDDKFVYTPKKYSPQEEDRGVALIFYDPGCPFSIYFSGKIRELIEEVAPAIPIRMVNQFEEGAEVKKRGKISACIVNRKPIMSFFLDKENFQKEVKEALDRY